MVTIYLIENLITFKWYIGQTTLNPIVRWQAHTTKLNNNIHTNSKLQNSWNKYGQDNFEFLCFDEYESLNESNEMERFYIDYFDTINNGYNIKEGGKNARQTETTKQILSQIKKEEWQALTEEDKQKRSFFLKKLSQSADRNVIERRAHTLKERYKDPTFKERWRKSQCKVWKGFISPTGEEVEIFGLKQFCLAHGLSDANMIRVAQGKRTQHKGWRYKPFKD